MAAFLAQQESINAKKTALPSVRDCCCLLLLFCSISPASAVAAASVFFRHKNPIVSLFSSPSMRMPEGFSIMTIFPTKIRDEGIQYVQTL